MEDFFKTLTTASNDFILFLIPVFVIGFTPLAIFSAVIGWDFFSVFIVLVQMFLLLWFLFDKELIIEANIKIWKKIKQKLV